MNPLRLETFDNLAALTVAYSLSLLGALALLIGGWLLSGWTQRATRRALNRSVRVSETLKPLLVNLIRYVILAVVFIAVLAQFGIQTASILAIVGAAGLAIGLALQGTLSNVASGVMILFLRPFDVGDEIDAEGVSGMVREIGLFTTELVTSDGVYVMVPNGQIFGRTIRNLSRLPTRRVDVPVGVSYGDDIEKALTVAMSVLRADARVLREPAPQVMVAKLGDTAVNLNLRCWTMQRNYWDVFFGVNKAIKQRLDAEGLAIPFVRPDVRAASPVRSRTI